MGRGGGGVLETDTAQRGVSGSNLVKRVSVLRVSPSQGHSVRILVTMIDIVMLVQVLSVVVLSHSAVWPERPLPIY